MRLPAVTRCCPFLLRIPLRGTLDDLTGMAKGTGAQLTLRKLVALGALGVNGPWPTLVRCATMRTWKTYEETRWPELPHVVQCKKSLIPS